MRHFEFSNSDRRFLIIEPKNPYKPIFPEKLEFFQNFIHHIRSTILKFANLIGDS